MLAQKIINAIHLCRSLFSKEYHRTFENALILPHFNYLGTIYGRTNKTKLHEILYKNCQNSLNVYRDIRLHVFVQLLCVFLPELSLKVGWKLFGNITILTIYYKI